MDDYNKDFRVWWNTDGDEFEFFVDTIDEAKIVLKTLTRRDLQDDTIGYNAGGLEERNHEADEWNEWYDDDGRDITEVMNDEA